ncbi:stage V sporulation protein B [Sporobacter termitidis DSM 10068]|uniref:Stage V sporulation protein B n=1 Tax=Sporobacter termitidis DSM 10068 TaxID=1123282 RepID=A0A1M5WMC7_9FIRM|nr:polysaccharide biosynthesis protein [Sporobacter termitidis]SHH88701.1 stage V sporulation protein B [Sporobacter termitidis DSM 10068]
MRKLNFLHGSFVVAFINILIGLIGFFYNVILSKLIGAEGIGLFQMTSSVLMPFLIITTGGIPTAVSRLVAEQRSGNSTYTGRRIFESAVVFTLAVSLCLSLILIALAGIISSGLFVNEELLPCLLLAAPAVVIISMTAVFRGYLYGMRLMTAAGASEIIEHLTRFLIVIGFLTLLQPVSPAWGAAIAVCGISVGELADLIWLIWVEKREAARLPRPKLSPAGLPGTLTVLLDIAGPLTLTGLSSTIMQSANAVLIPLRLMASGLSGTEAAAEFGRLTGMVFPLVYLPFTVTSALVVNIIPNLSAQYSARNSRKALRTIRQAVGLTLAAAVPLAVLYVTLSQPLGAALYHDAGVGGLIRAMGGATVFLALQHTFSGILNSIGKQNQATFHRLAGLCVQLGVAYWLVGNPDLGVSGYVVSFYLYTLIVCVLDGFAIRRGFGPPAARQDRRALRYSS